MGFRVHRISRFASLALAMLFAVTMALPTAASAQDSSGDRKVVERVEPTYPPLAQRNGLSGTVKLRVIIGPDGRPRKVEVLGGNPVFVDNASDSVKKWKWATSDRETTETVQLNFSPRS